jgi:hypothetical protein
MFIKIVTIVFYAAIALWAFGAAFPLLMPILGLSALILVVAQFMN